MAATTTGGDGSVVEVREDTTACTSREPLMLSSWIAPVGSSRRARCPRGEG
jgi:hypothetical protein